MTLVEERLSLSEKRLREIPEESNVPMPYGGYFKEVALFLLRAMDREENTLLYRDILPGCYETSYANPSYAAQKLGVDMGPVLSAVYAECYAVIPAVFENNKEDVASVLELFLELYFEFESTEIPAVSTVRSIFRTYLLDYMPSLVSERVREQVDLDDSFAGDIIERADFTDTAYLYEYGEYVSPDTLKTAAFINSLPEETVRKMADSFTEGYRLGFVHAGKDLSKKKTVQIVYELGFERMIRLAIRNFASMGLQPTILRAPAHLVLKTANRHNGYTGAIPNPQFDEDHKKDLALVMDEDYSHLRSRAHQEAFENVRELAALHAGPAVLETFGQMPFSPRTCSFALDFTEHQRDIFLSMKNTLLSITHRYIPQTERSFTIIDFPVPAIGENFEDIFRETIKVNTLDSDRYTAIQQKLIDALDQGTCVRVRGCGKNETDLMVMLHPLEDPAHQTIFENCVADVNIPVGEVFTSPVLKGTTGLLHVSHVFLEGYEFRDLRIRLEDGMVTDYSCRNFESETDNRAYIEDNILFHHPTLTIGEFAIGTNTTAYRMIQTYGIGDRMPILIAEKTGPHFAMGDTCYSFEEDNPVFNPDGKEVIARDNEHTLVRREHPEKAYYGCHTDITIPYDELGSIRVIKENGDEIPLIERGRYVLPGTEELNGPLEQ